MRRTSIALAAVAGLVHLPAIAQHQGVESPSRPTLEVAAANYGCPIVAGSFVALLDPDRGMFLLSAAPYPGGQPVDLAIDDGVTLTPPGGESWPVGRIGAGEEPPPLWGAVYPFRNGGGAGCVAFDKQRFSAEGDLVTYLRWLVDEVYLQLPGDARGQWPALLLSDRQVKLWVVKPGYKPLALSGKEGATLAFRSHDSERIILMMPFVLDEVSAHVAVKIAYTDEPFWQGAEKHPIAFVVATPAQAVELEDLGISVVVENVAEAPVPQ